MLARVKRALEEDKLIQGLVAAQGKAAKRMKHNDHSKRLWPKGPWSSTGF